ncbi:MAG TPA: inositol monophosphatase family protein [Acidimicrobiia bacterium]|nr:inositol monophosphatase family protein [Acidimicrobiia bacterium]
MQKNALAEKEIDSIADQLIDTALHIRGAIDNMDSVTRRAKTHGLNVPTNQYELDVLADNIVHDDFSNFSGYVVSEEREVNEAEVKNSLLLLVVDPVDGSTNASHGLGYWCFSAALVYNGNVVAGVVVDQVTGRIFRATEHGGATLTLPTGTVRSLDSLQFRQEDVGTIADSFASSTICFTSHGASPHIFRHLRNFGASALAICDVASGGFDAYIDDDDVMLKPWDILAALYIAQRSGCTVLRRDSDDIMAPTGVLVSRSETLLSDFQTLFPDFFH